MESNVVGAIRYDLERSDYVFAMSESVEWDAELAANCFAAVLKGVAERDDIDHAEFQAATMRIIMGGGIE